MSGLFRSCILAGKLSVRGRARAFNGVVAWRRRAGFVSLAAQVCVHPAAQQMTHNVMRKFAGQETALVILTNVDSVTSGNWTSLYGTNYWIADTTPFTN